MKIAAQYKKGPFLPKTETWIYNQIKYLKVFKPIVYCHGVTNCDLFPLDNIRNVNITINTSFVGWKALVNNIYARLFLMWSIQRDRPDIIHAHFGPSGYNFLPFKKMFKIPMITTFYGFDVNMLPLVEPVWRIYYQQLFNEGELFLVEGNFMKQSLVKLGCSQKKIFVQHLGVELEKIRFESRFLKDGEMIKILLSGSFIEKKGIPFAIEAIGIFKQKNSSLKLKVTIIGDSNGQLRSDEEKMRIIESIKKNGIEEDVNFLGYQPHQVFIDELYKNHIFLSPSITATDGDNEGGVPVSIIEASASGMPILSTTHCDIPEVVINGESGFLVLERNADALAEKLEFLFNHPENWESMGFVGRQHIEKNYDLNKQVKNLEHIYESFLK